MSATSLMYYNEQWGKVDPRVLRVQYEITSAGVAVPIIPNSASSVWFSALSSQAQVDNVLGTEDEFLYTAWGSTAMGADALGGVINMGGQSGQVAVITQMVAKCYSGTGGATLVTRQCQAGTVSDTLQTAVQLGAYGNIGFQVDFGNTPDFDGLTSGTIEIEIHWIAK
jgi:hypothetical protein